MTEQCIICLEDLAIVVPEHLAESGPNLEVAESSGRFAGVTNPPHKPDNQHEIALIRPCAHVLHDECLREWSRKANSCPICRSGFNVVEVLDKVGGTVLSDYVVEDKKQIAEFDPSAWVDDEPEEEEVLRPCPVCGGSENEDVLLLCERCDAPYHTYCIGLDSVPAGSWFCMECAAEGAYIDAAALQQSSGRRVTRREFPRTQAEQRQSRRRTRPDQWLGAWSRLSRTIHDVVGLDLDFSEDDQTMNSYRHHQHLLSIEARNRDQWRQRYRIAERQGAREAFESVAALSMRAQPPSPAPPVESAEQTKAWQEFERARQAQTNSPRGRKRKSRSVSATPEASQATQAPERKLKRPRTRRIPDTAGPSSLQMQNTPTVATGSRTTSRPLNTTTDEPSFLSSLLREVEIVKSSDVSTPQSTSELLPVPSRPTSPPMDYSSPGSSPSPTSSIYHSPRAMSATPPPVRGQRSSSPVPLSTRVEPVFTRPDQLTRPTKEQTNNTESNAEEPTSTMTESRRSRPRRQTPDKKPRSKNISPARLTMSSEAKENVNRIVKAALSPHWKSNELTKEQYSNINRDVSRILYELIANRNLADVTERTSWERLANERVEIAVKALTA